ncbi:LysR family transcriptional regulator [Amphritea pacifica]|uniref:LysR family transcriptional regulator n=1 Tax=Amphritea pacifica TaxID=2811233 RepID=A0ABS2W7Z6_9GAMM|nr:LysR family transcriptional regulator [Amphritea pacifica]MBN0987824.1 LysR family transcriptional regulator [Amphritea pacifica]MBN1008102.1 LysR family transcriptional regulator [Amphritea pacifica]
MEIGLLRTFLEVSRTRHFGKAAQNLYLTQSAVSFRIRHLEELIGVPLFSRQRNNILLTAAGERLIPHAENIIKNWQLALQDVAISQEQDLQLVLGGISNLWGTFLQSTLPKLADSFPSMVIRTEINNHLELTRSLLSGTLDLAIVLDPPSLNELGHQQIGQIELALVSSYNDLMPDQVQSHDFVYVDWGMAFNLRTNKLFKKPMTPVLHTEQSQIALEFILSHGGSAFLPLVLVGPYLESERLHRVNNIKPVKRSVYAVYVKDSERYPQLKPIIDKLCQYELKPEMRL